MKSGDRQISFDRDAGDALEAARALVALREGDNAEAESLPWSSIDLLRVHVPPAVVVELACGAGHDAAAR